MARKCYFVSDLHLLASRSEAHRHFDAIVAAASTADDFVLGGDIFDFRWAQTRSHHHAVDQAIGWLRELTGACPNCYFHYLLGNHDHQRRFIERLAHLAAGLTNLSWHPYFVRLESAVFLHGDAADRRRMDSGKLADARTRCLNHKSRSVFLSRVYDVVVWTRVHRPLPRLVHRRRKVARRILRYLEGIGHGPRDGVRNVYFGHTHAAVADYEYRGVKFHNGGTTIKGMDFRIVEVEF